MMDDCIVTSPETGTSAYTRSNPPPIGIIETMDNTQKQQNEQTTTDTPRKRSDRPERRIILNAETAYEIYKLKIQIMTNSLTFSSAMMSRSEKIRGKSKPIALKYHVSTKTIRDIWNRKTWVDATRILWADDLDELFFETPRSQQVDLFH